MSRPVPRRRWSDEQLAAAVKVSASWRGAMRELGLKSTSAGAISIVRRRADELGLDTSHFRGMRRWSDAQLRTAISDARTWEELIHRLGLSPNSGSIRPFLESHALRLGLDCAHLTAHPPTRFPDSAGSAPAPNQRHIREAGPSIASSWFTLCGCPVSFPIEPATFDLLVSMPEGIKRLQVKTSTCDREHGWHLGVGRRPYTSKGLGPHTPYDPGDIDYFFVVDGDLTMYLIPSQVIAGRVGILLRAYSQYAVGSARGLMTQPAIPSLSNSRAECQTRSLSYYYG